MLCLKCNKVTDNPKFCSRSCSASYNNIKFPKRLPEGNCKKCDKIILASRTYCKRCFKSLQFPRDITLQEAIYYKHHKSSAFALVRSRARAIAKKLGITICQVCNYNKHVEIAHKMPISHFPLETLLSVINDPSNLFAFCPNCHWEFDHGLLKKKITPIGLLVSPEGIEPPSAV